MGIGGVKGKVKVKGDEVQEEEDDGLGNFRQCGKKLNNKKKTKGTMASSGTLTRLRGKGRQGKGQMSSRSTRNMTDDELDDEPVLGKSRIKNEDAEYASLPFTAMMADDDTPCPTPRSTKVWGSIPWMFDEDEEEAEAETDRDDSCETVPIPRSVEEIPSKILRPSTLPLLSSFSSTKEDDTTKSTKRSKTIRQEKSSPTINTSTATFPKNTSSSSSTPTTYSTMLSPPNPSSSATTATIQEKEELDKQQDPNANSHSNDLFFSPFWETAQAESTAISTGESSSSAKLMKKKMKEKEKKRSYHIFDIDAAHCSRSGKKAKRSNDDDDDVGGGSSSSSKVGGRGTRKKRVPLAVLEDYPVGQ